MDPPIPYSLSDPASASRNTARARVSSMARCASGEGLATWGVVPGRGQYVEQTDAPGDRRPGQPGARLREPPAPPAAGKRAGQRRGRAGCRPAHRAERCPAAVAPPPQQAMKYGYVPILGSGAMLSPRIASSRSRASTWRWCPSIRARCYPRGVGGAGLEAGHGTPAGAVQRGGARDHHEGGVRDQLERDGPDGAQGLAGQIQTAQDLKGKRVSLMVEGAPIDSTMRRVLYRTGSVWATSRCSG